MKLIVTEPLLLNGEPHERGEILDVDYATGTTLLSSGRTAHAPEEADAPTDPGPEETTEVKPPASK